MVAAMDGLGGRYSNVDFWQTGFDLQSNLDAVIMLCGMYVGGS
jgi:hypothetical protein